MKPEYVAQYERLEREHWWWRVRRRLVLDFLREWGSPAAAGGRPSLVDIGCGAGMNLAAYRGEFEAEGIEPDAVLAEAARANAGVPVSRGSLDSSRPLCGREFDNGLLLDVIEHLDDDAAGLKKAAGCLRPGGTFILNVPAMPFLWSVHDEANEHRRRYTRRTLEAAVGKAGLRLAAARYWGGWLVPAAVAARKLLAPAEGVSEYRVSVPPRAIGLVLEGMTAFEFAVTGWTGAPWGLSLLAAARKVET